MARKCIPRGARLTGCMMWYTMPQVTVRVTMGMKPGFHIRAPRSNKVREAFRIPSSPKGDTGARSTQVALGRDPWSDLLGRRVPVVLVSKTLLDKAVIRLSVYSVEAVLFVC